MKEESGHWASALPNSERVLWDREERGRGLDQGAKRESKDSGRES